ncbi:hypothetical protein FHP05_11120 [Cerasibacillus terrae]|uniref:Uncharacterized protein n=1 Tax=Cerasibacillus terrae TaxID=2498845 RepID=A0A5C8NQG0_9BACI|nr:hypothetical protein [Cerasibacillus terrae]TXL63357.1 hypothetical protein FHP05_11120 [Cerasibacillus terrae]
MNFTLNNLVPIVSFLLSTPPIVYLIVKVMSRNHIEIVLEDKYKNKMNELAIILIISLSLAIIISMSANSLFKENVNDFITNVLLIILPFIFLVYIITLLISSISLNVNQSGIIRNKQRVSKYYKVNFIIQFLSILCINAMLFILISDQEAVEEKAIIVAIIALMYMLSILLLNSSLSKVVKNKNHYEIRIIDNKLNETLKNLILLYSLNKEMLIMRNKVDVDKSINDLEDFYVYYLDSGFIHRYRKY